MLSLWLRRIHCIINRERGQSLVELAIMLPILLLMLAGMVDLGLGVVDSIIVINATGAGARYGAVYPSDTAGITARVQAVTAGTSVTIASANITVSFPTGNASGNRIRVQSTYQFPTILGSFLGMNTITLRKTIEAVIL